MDKDTTNAIAPSFFLSSAELKSGANRNSRLENRLVPHASSKTVSFGSVTQWAQNGRDENQIEANITNITKAAGLY